VHASTLLIGFQEISASTVPLSSQTNVFFFRRKPVFECLFLAHGRAEACTYRRAGSSARELPKLHHGRHPLRVEWPREKLTSNPTSFSKQLRPKSQRQSSFALSYFEPGVGADYNRNPFSCSRNHNLSAMLFDNFPGLFARTIGKPSRKHKRLSASFVGF